MLRGASTRLGEDTLARVYGAALAASGDPRAAEDVTAHVFVAARGDAGRPDRRLSPRLMVEQALLVAVRSSPHPAFAAMVREDRQAVVLARLAGYTVAEIATALAIAPAEVRRRLRRGLEATLHYRAMFR